MTAITTAAAGNWSASGTWTGGIVPGDGDTVTLNHNVTVDVATTVGHSPGNADAVKAIAWGTVNKVLTVNAPLTVRGDISLKGNTTKTTVISVSGSGAGIEFDSSASASPSTTKYRLLTQDAANGYTLIHFNGTSANPVYLRSNSGGGNAYLTRGGFSVGGWLRASYCDFTRIGDGTNPFYDFYLGNNSGAEIDLSNCIFDACGLLTSSTAVVTGGKISLVNCTWKNGAHSSKSVVLPAFTNTGTKLIDDNTFDKQVDIGQGAWVVTDNLFLDKYVATAGTKWSTSSGGNMVCNTTTGALNVYADLTNEFWYKRGTQSNPQHLTLGVTSSLTVDGCIFACENANAVGDAIQPGSPSGARTYTVRNTILLPDEDQVVQPGKLFGLASVNSNVTAVSEHNTYISTAAGETGTSYGETYAGYDGIFSSIKSNLAWSPNSGEASIAIRQAGTVQQSDATKWDYNAVWHPRTGSDGAGYNSISAGTIFSSGSPGAHDVLVTADPFVDSTRNLATWDAALGGAGTSANALTELAKRNDRSGYNTAYAIADLVTWVKAGFAVTDASLLNAGHDGVTIGAGVFVHQATATVALALDVAATGTVASAGGVTGTASVPLTISVVSTGTVPRTGTATAALALDISAVGSIGNVPIAGVATAPLSLGITATGTVPRTGTASAVIPVRVAATGTVPRTGTTTVTLTLAASASGVVGNVPRTGSAVLSLALRATSSGTVPRSGAAVVPISLAIAATGTVPRTGTALVALFLDVAAVGTVTTGAPYVGQIRLTAARGPTLALYAGNGPTLSLAASNGAALRLTPQESVS